MNVLQAVVAGAVLAVCGGCASSNVNPPQARAQRGYVDFYAPGETNLYWEIKEAARPNGELKTVFSTFKPVRDGVVRLELAPGPHQFELTFLNRVIEAPLWLEFSVEEGKVTPVKVELVAAGERSLAQKEQQVGRNIRGVGRTSQYSSQTGAVEQIVALVQPAIPYRMKEQTGYGQGTTGDNEQKENLKR